MKSVKEGGTAEVGRLRNRIGRALGKGSITRQVHDELRDLLDQIQDIIDNMEEKDEDGAT